MRRPVAGRCDVDNAEIDTDKAGRREANGFRKVDRHEQEPSAIFAPYKVALALGSGKPPALIFAHHVGHQDSTFEGQERDAVEQLEGRNPLIVRLGRKRSEARTNRLVSLVCAAHFGDATDVICDESPNRSRSIA